MKPLSSTLVSVIVAQIQNLYLVVTWPGFVGRNYVELSKVVVCVVASVLMATASTAQEPATFQFSGTLKSFPKTSFRIQLAYNPSNLLEGSGVVADGMTDANGKFSTKFEVAEGQVFLILFDRKYYRLWAKPGHGLEISVADNKVTCSGSLSAENQFLFDTQLAPDPLSTRTHEKFDAEKYRRLCNETEKARLQKLDDARKGFEKSERFHLYAKSQIVACSANDKNKAALMAIGKKELAKSDLPKDYFDFWDSFPVLDDSAALLSRNYQSALQNKFQRMAELELIKEGVTPVDVPARFVNRQLKIQAAQLSTQPKTNELLNAVEIMNMIQYMPVKDTNRAIHDFTTKFPNSEYQKTIDNAVAKALSIDLAAIDKACRFRDVNGMQVKFSELNGKVIYVDFWGTWCKACLLQQPDLEKLIERFSDNDEVVFLSLNFSDAHDDWKAFVEQKKLKGLHWKTVGDEEKLAELFVLNNSFPRYMIFGKKGELISPSAPFPGHKGLPEILEDATR